MDNRCFIVPTMCIFCVLYYCVLYIVPSAPVIKDLTPIDSESVHVEWNIPIVNYGIITIYTIYYTIENGPERSLIVPSNGQDVST